jgi:3D (Asp-Asp-Asp) domain-containing protein
MKRIVINFLGNLKMRILLLLIFFLFILFFLSSFKYYVINVFNEKELIAQKILFSNNTYKVIKNIFENYNTDEYENSINIQKKVIIIDLHKKSYKEVVIDNKYKYILPLNFSTTKYQLLSYIDDIISKDFSNNNKKVKYKIHKFNFVKDKVIYVYLLNSIDFYFGDKKITIYYYKDQQNYKSKIYSNLKSYIYKNFYKLVNNKNIKLEKITDIDILDKNEYQLVSFKNNSEDDYNLNIKDYQLNFKAQISYKKNIEYNVIYKYTDKLPLGTQKVLINGQNGISIIKELRNYKSCNEYEIIYQSELILKKPVNKIVLVGIKELNLKEDKILKVLEMEASGYTGGVGNVGYFTSTGHRVRRGVVAVDPNVIKLGTKLYVQGYGYAQALDVGSAIKGNKIDLYFETYQEAIEWGRRKVKVFILKD